MGYRLGRTYMEQVFNPKAWGWQETKASTHLLAGDVQAMSDHPRVEALHTWTRADQTITLAMEGDWYIVAAFVNGVRYELLDDIHQVLDLLEAKVSNPEPLRAFEVDGQVLPGLGEEDLREIVAKSFHADPVDEPENDGLVHVAVVEWKPNGACSCAPTVATATTRRYLLIRLLRVLSADPTRLAHHVDADFLEAHPLPVLEGTPSDRDPVVYEVDAWLDALADWTSDPWITFHTTPLATGPNSPGLDGEWGLTRREIAALVEVGARAAWYHSEIGTGADYDAFELALGEVPDAAATARIGRAAYRRVVLRQED